MHRSDSIVNNLTFYAVNTGLVTRYVFLTLGSVFLTFTAVQLVFAPLSWYVNLEPICLTFIKLPGYPVRSNAGEFYFHGSIFRYE
jgi:hypothetical protein